MSALIIPTTTNNPSFKRSKSPSVFPTLYPSKNPSEIPTVIPTVVTDKPTYQPSIIPSIVLIKENNNNNLNDNNIHEIVKNSTVPSIIIIVFISICIMWIVLCKCVHSKAKKHRNSTISAVNDDCDDDDDENENEDIEMIEGEYEYIVEFISKPFGMVFTKGKYDKNVFIEAVETNSFAETHGVIIGSKIIKFENENVEDLGAKNIKKIFNTYSNKLPLKITFRTQTLSSSSTATSTSISSSSTSIIIKAKNTRQNKIYEV